MSKQTVLPNFFIVGAARAATSSLWLELGKHPDIFMSPDKEAQFFGFFDTHRSEKAKYKSLDEYAQLFADAGSAQVIGEATPTYLALPECALSIKEHCPDAKILISLRNPMDRAFSYYEMSMSKGREKSCSFEEWLQSNEFFLEQGKYAPQVERYISCFGREKVKIVLYEDVSDEMASVLLDLHEFLGVERLKPSAEPEVYNAGGSPRSLMGKVLYRATTNQIINKRLRPLIPNAVKQKIHSLRSGFMRKGEMSVSTRARLANHFLSDIKKTASMIDRDLDHWVR